MSATSWGSLLLQRRVREDLRTPQIPLNPPFPKGEVPLGSPRYFRIRANSPDDTLALTDDRCLEPTDLSRPHRHTASSGRDLSFGEMSGKLSDMGNVTVRELQQQTKSVIERVEHGEIIEVLRRRRPVARLSPVPQHQKPGAWPDLAKRVRDVFGKRTIKPGASRAVVDARGER